MLEHIFGSTTRVKLLQVFFRRSEHSFFVRELSRLIDSQLNAVRRELGNLERCGIITAVDAPDPDADEKTAGTARSKYYKLNGGNLLVPELRSLLLKAQVLEEQEFVAQIQKKGGDVTFFLLSGVFTDVKDGETDLLLVGNLKVSTVARIIHDFETTINSQIRYTIMTEKEYLERREIGDRFLYAILEAKHLVVVNKYDRV